MKIVSYGSKSKGYELLNDKCSPDASKYERDAVKSMVTSFIGVGDSPAVRFAPIPKAGENQYLLTVILRGVKTPGEDRGHYETVSFLMDGQEADELFSYPFTVIYNVVRRTAMEIVSQKQVAGWESALFDGLGRENKESRIEVPSMNARRALFMAAARGRSDKLRTQVVYACPKTQEAVSALSWLLRELPQILRKSLSFFLNAAGLGETQGEFLVFLTGTQSQTDNQSGGGSFDRSKYVSGELTVSLLDKSSGKWVEVFLNEQDNSLAKFAMDVSEWEKYPISNLWECYHRIAEIFSAGDPEDDIRWTKVNAVVGPENARRIEDAFRQQVATRALSSSETNSPEKWEQNLQKWEEPQRNAGENNVSPTVAENHAHSANPSETPQERVKKAAPQGAAEPGFFADVLRNNLFKVAALVLAFLLAFVMDATLIWGGMRGEKKATGDEDKSSAGQIKISAVQTLAQSVSEESGAAALSGVLRVNGRLQTNGENELAGTVKVKREGADGGADMTLEFQAPVMLESFKRITPGQKRNSKWSFGGGSSWEIGLSARAALSTPVEGQQEPQRTEALLQGTVEVTNTGKTSGTLNVTGTAHGAKITGELAVEGNVELLGLEEEGTQTTSQLQGAIPYGPYLIITSQGILTGASGMAVGGFRLLGTNLLTVIVIVLLLTIRRLFAAKGRKRNDDRE